jgi:hypothetical protein
MVSAGTLAAAALTPNDVPQAVPQPTAGPAFAAAARKMARVRQDWVTAREAVETLMATVTAWEAETPFPESKRKRKRWFRQREALSYTPPINAAWNSQVEAENAYRAAQMEVAQIPSASRADLLAKACLAVAYDAEKLSNRSAGIIAFGVAADIVRLELDDGKVVQS